MADELAHYKKIRFIFKPQTFSESISIQSFVTILNIYMCTFKSSKFKCSTIDIIIHTYVRIENWIHIKKYQALKRQ